MLFSCRLRLGWREIIAPADVRHRMGGWSGEGTAAGGYRTLTRVEDSPLSGTDWQAARDTRCGRLTSGDSGGRIGSAVDCAPVVEDTWPNHRAAVEAFGVCPGMPLVRGGPHRLEV